MEYLTAKQIFLIHSLAVDETGGLHGTRDHNAILSIEALPLQKFGGQELYPGIFDKAAVYARSIIFNHPFLDGNKRTGISSAIIFLENNGWIFTAKEGEIESFAVSIVVEKLEIQVIAQWLKKHINANPNEI